MGMPLGQFSMDGEVMDAPSVTTCMVAGAEHWSQTIAYGTEADIDAISSKLNATQEDGLYVAPCSRSVSLTFTINGVDYVLDQDDLHLEARSDGSCVLALGGYALSSVESWSLGAPFMRKFYTQFDIGRQRMGLAPATTAAGRRLMVLV